MGIAAFQNNINNFGRDGGIGIGYSFTKKLHVSYHLTFDNKIIFSYCKRKKILGGNHSPTSDNLLESYFGSDNEQGMVAIIDNPESNLLRFSPEFKKKVKIGIHSGNIIEIHSSYNTEDKDTTFYIYSKSLAYIESLCSKKIEIPYLQEIAYQTMMYALKLKIPDGSQKYSTSIVFTSKNFPEGDASRALENTFFFGKSSKNQILPDMAEFRGKFYTYEVSYNNDQKFIENFILFSILRNYTNGNITG